MNTPSSVACCCIRTRSPSRAPPLNGELGPLASTPTRCPALRNWLVSAPVTVDFPTPGAPVRPITRAVPGLRSLSASRSPSSILDRMRARVRTLSMNLDYEGLALTAAAAQGRRAGGGLARRLRGAAAAQLVDELYYEAGTGSADRVADRDRAAIHVHPVRVDPQIPDGLDGDGGEGLVDLYQVQVFRVEALLGEGLHDRVGRLGGQ